MRHFHLFQVPGIAAILATAALAGDGDLSERLRHRLEVLPVEALAARNRPLHVPAGVAAFYRDRVWVPVWVRPDSGTRQSLQALVSALEAASVHGLSPAHYHLEALREAIDDTSNRVGALPATPMLADIELLATDAFLALGSHYANGRVDPVTIDPDWHLTREPRAALSALRDLNQDRFANSSQALESLLPDYPEYRLLMERLALQRRLAEEVPWPEIMPGPLLRPGESDARVLLIQARMRMLGDLDPDPEAHAIADAKDPVYTSGLESAVQAFQRRHGLEPDGVIGPRTLAELNTSPERRIAQIRANMERWRWMPSELGAEHIRVNIAGFRMDVMSGNKLVMRKRAIVGRPYRRTPVFSGNMTYLVLNPSWEVPSRLAANDQLPQIQADPGYLDRMGFQILSGWGAEERRIDPSQVDWSALDHQNFPFRLRQAPGPLNALGQVKFMFPNQHNVYLHDTPARDLFAQEERAFSSGCIRVDEPMDLVDWLLSGPGRPRVMTPEEIRRILDSGTETTVRLGRALPVHLLYWTAWVGEDGRIQYRPDIYGRDAPLIEALDRAPNGIQH